MASNPQANQNQQSGRQGDSLSGSIQTENQAGNQQRSEGLLPAGGRDDGQDDGRFDVAEEVSLDQQSDQMRHVGQAPDLGAEARSVDDDPDAAAEDVLPDPGKQSDG